MMILENPDDFVSVVALRTASSFCVRLQLYK